MAFWQLIKSNNKSLATNMKIFTIWTWLVIENTKRNCKFHCTAVSLCNFKFTNAHLMEVRIVQHILRARFRLTSGNSGVKPESPIIVVCWCTPNCVSCFPVHAVYLIIMLMIWIKYYVFILKLCVTSNYWKRWD